MPKVFEWNGYRFFYSNEGNPLEPVHIHVRQETRVAKVWIEPDVALASLWGMAAEELSAIEAVVRENESRIKEKWDEYFGD